MSSPRSSPVSSPAPSIGPIGLSAVVGRLRGAGCVFAEEEALLLVSAAESPAELAAMVDRRAAGVPLEQILGWAEFCGLRVFVEPGVFVPRRRTELLVREAAAVVHAGAAAPPAVVVDLCCGAGAVGAAVAASLYRPAVGPGAPGAVELHAVDVDPAAVHCARRNLAAYGGRVYAGDLYEPLPRTLRGRVDVLVANAPYVPAEEIELMPPEARLHEPAHALDGGGTDGLDVLRRVVAGAPGWLAPGGSVLVETSRRQAPLLVGVLERAGLAPRVIRSDELQATVVAGESLRSGVPP